MRFLNFYFTPSGRIGRGKFWLGILGLTLIQMIFNLWLQTSMFNRDVLDGSTGALTKPALQLALISNLIFLFPLFNVLAKRLHDRNKGALLALPFLISSIAFIAAAVVYGIDTTQPNMILGALATLNVLFFLWIVIELGCLKGTSGDNRYGPDPLARSA